MNNLFIIGNGFDLAHKMKTSYEDFHEYLKEIYPNFDKSSCFVDIPEAIQMPDGEEEYEEEDIAAFIVHFINQTEGDEWNNLEHSLGRLEYSEFFETAAEAVPLDEDGDVNMWKLSYLHEDIARNLVFPVISITNLFTQWINTIEIDEKIVKKVNFEKILNKNLDCFLTFNYTETLEKKYNLKNVCHIHGKQGENLIFGHGNEEGYYEYYMSKYIGAEDDIDRIHNLLRKDTTDVISNHKIFFDDVVNLIGNIYSFGFSFSEVDLVYIVEICKRIDTKHITWFFNDYDLPEQIETFKEKVRKCGFEGEFELYHI